MDQVSCFKMRRRDRKKESVGGGGKWVKILFFMWHMRRILRQIGALQDKMDKRRLQTILDQREPMKMPSPSRNVPLIAHNKMLLFFSVLIGGMKGNTLRNCTIIKP